MSRRSLKYTLTKEEAERKRLHLFSLAKAVAESPHRDISPECYVVKPERYQEGIDEIFHLDLGPKAVHCLVTRTEGIRKKKKVYEFCYHWRGCCRCTKLMLKRKTL